MRVALGGTAALDAARSSVNAQELAINTLRGGFDVASMWLQVAVRVPVFGFRASVFLRVSGFGLRISALPALLPFQPAEPQRDPAASHCVRLRPTVFRQAT
jgi:hypothetical protein